MNHSIIVEVAKNIVRSLTGICARYYLSSVNLIQFLLDELKTSNTSCLNSSEFHHWRVGFSRLLSFKEIEDKNVQRSSLDDANSPKRERFAALRRKVLLFVSVVMSAFCVTAHAQTISLSKALTGETGATAGVVEAGETLTYTITLTNTDTVDGDISVTETVPVGTVYVGGDDFGTAACIANAVAGTACTVTSPSVPAGGTQTMTFIVQATSPISTASVENVVIETGETPPVCTAADATDPSCVSTPTAASITLSKALTGESGIQTGVAEVGETLTYTVTLTNAGGTAGTISVTETVPVGTVNVIGDDFETATCIANAAAATTCTVTSPSVPANSSATMTFSVQVTNPVSTASIENVVIETGDTPPVCTAANATDPRCVTTPTTSVSLSKALTTESGSLDGVAEIGETLTYTITLTNVGDTASDFSVTETVPVGTVNVAGDDFSCAANAVAGTSCTVTSPVIPAGDSATMTFSVQVTNTIISPSIDNTVIEAGDSAPICTTANATDPRCVSTPTVQGITLSKALTGESGIQTDVAEVGETLTYAVTLTNAGGTAGTISVTETVPVGTVNVIGDDFETATCIANAAAATTCTVTSPSVPANSSATMTFSVQVTNPVSTASIENMVIETGDTPPVCTAADATDPRCVTTPTTSVSISKALTAESGAQAGIAEAGETLTYTITLTNVGDTDSDFSITETVPIGTINVVGDDFSCAANAIAGTSCTVTSPVILAGDSATMTFSVQVTDPVLTPSIENIVIEAGHTPPVCTAANATDPRCVTVPTTPGITLSKALTGETGSVAGRIESGETLTYTITLSNNDVVDGTISVTEVVPLGTTYVGGDDFISVCTAGDGPNTVCTVNSPLVPANGTATMTFRVRVDSILARGSVDNVVIETGDARPVCTTANRSDPRCVSLAKQCTTMADIFEAPGDQVTIGGITISATRGNAGLGRHTGASGGRTNGTYTRIQAQQARFIDNNTFARGMRDYIYHRLNFSEPVSLEAPMSMNDIDGAANSDTREVAAIIGGNAGAYVNPTYTRPAGNGPGFGTRASVRDPAGLSTTSAFRVALAANVGNIGFTANRGIFRATFASPVTDVYFMLGIYDNGAANNTRLSGISNFCMEDVLPKLSISKELVNESIANDGIAQPGEELTYRVSVLNFGGSSPATVTETVPVGTTKVAGDDFDSATCVDGAAAGTSCTLSYGTVPRDGTVSREFTVRVVDPIPSVLKSIANVATFDGIAPPDCSAADDSDPSCVVIPTAPDITVSKALTSESGSIAGVAEAGETLTYTLTLSNTGGSPGTIDVQEIVPASTTYAGSDDFTSVCTAGDAAATVCTVQSPQVPVDGTATMTFSVDVTDPITAESIDNLVIEDGTTPPMCLASDATDPRCVTTPTAPEISLSKALTAESGSQAGIAEAGETLTYTITLNNAGGTAGTISVTETVPVGTVNVVGDDFVTATCAANAAAGTACTVTSPSVPAGGTATMTYSVQVTDPITTTSIENVVIETGDPAPVCTAANATDPRCVTTPTAPEITVSKALTSENGSVAGVAEAGETLTYTITLTNAGGTADTISVTETVPAGTVNVAGDDFVTTDCVANAVAGTACIVTSPSVPAGGSATMTFSVQVTNPIIRTSIENLVIETGDPAPVCTAANATDPRCVTTPTAPEISLSKALTAESGSQAGIAEAGETLTYTITLSNAGGTANTISVTETVPAGTVNVVGDDFVTAACVANAVAGTACTVTSPSVPAGGTATMTYSVQVTDPISTTSIENVVIETGDPAPVCTAANATDPRCVTTPTAPEISLSKALTAESGSQAGIAEAGETLTYTITLSNAGGTADTISVTETVPAGTVNVIGDDFVTAACVANAAAGTACTVTSPSVPAGGTATMTYSVQVTDPISTTSIDNVVIETGDPAPTCTAADATDPRCVTTPAAPEITLSKALTAESGSQAGIAEAGETLTYTITLTNAGGAGTISVTETVPAGTVNLVGDDFVTATCIANAAAGTACTVTSPSVPAGGTATMTYSVQVTNPISTTSIENVVIETGDPAPVCTAANATDPRCVTTPTAPEITLSKALTAESGSQAGIAEAGETLTYTITLSNAGGTADTISVTETVPAGTLNVVGDDFVTAACVANAAAGTACTVTSPSVPAGGTATMTYSVQVTDPISTTSIENVVIETGDPAPVCTAANATDPRCVTTPTAPEITLSKALTAESGSVAGVAEAGETLTYTITLSNAGGTANSISVTETVPAGTVNVVGDDFVTATCIANAAAGTACTVTSPSVSAGGTATMTYSVQVADPISTTSIDNVVIETGDPAPVCTAANATDPRCVTTPTAPEITLSKALTAESGSQAGIAEAGETLTYTITLTNAGGAGTISVTETVPAGTVNLVGDDFVTATCIANAAAGTACTVTSPSVSAGGTATMTYSVQVTDPISTTSIDNVVIETGDPAPVCTAANATDARCVTTPTEPEISLSKALTAESGSRAGIAEAGETLTYTITLSNAGGTADTISVTETVPAGTLNVIGDDFVTTNCVANAAAGTACIVTSPSVPAGGTAIMTYSVQVTDPITTTSIENVVIETGDPAPVCTAANATDPRCVTTPTAPEITLSKVLTAESGSVAGVAEAGETLTYTITLMNAGSAGTISITETVPAGTVNVIGDDFVTAACIANAAAGTACTVTSPAVPAAGTTTMTFSVQVTNPVSTQSIENLVVETGGTPPVCTTTNDVDPACVTTPTLPPITIGSFVWDDLNGDGQQGANEPPIAGAQIKLLVDNGAGSFIDAVDTTLTTVSEILTGATGVYRFNNLPAGDYKVQVMPPANYFPSVVQTIASNNNSEGDSNIATEVAAEHLNQEYSQ